MVKVEAVIRPDKLEAVKGALDEIGVKGLTVIQVLGCGKQKGYTRHYRGAEYVVQLLEKVKIETVIEYSQVEDVIDAIVSAARTGEIGDGKIFLTQIDDVVRIRTGERGQNALT